MCTRAHTHTHTHTHSHSQQEVLYIFFFGVFASALLTPVAMLINHLTLVPLTFLISDLYLCLTFLCPLTIPTLSDPGANQNKWNLKRKL